MSRFMEVQSADVNWTVYFALARKRPFVKSTEAVQERWVKTAWWGLEREDGSSAMDLGAAADGGAVMLCWILDLIYLDFRFYLLSPIL